MAEAVQSEKNELQNHHKAMQPFDKTKRFKTSKLRDSVRRLL